MAETTPMHIDIDLPEEVAQGEYANLAVIIHSTTEFVVDFLNVMPNVPRARVKSRIILTPENAKRLLLSLQENITDYESVHGRISVHTPQSADVGQMALGFNKMGEA